MQRRRENKIVVGLTGSFGSGKSTVAGIFKSCGAQVIDADKLAHECIKPGTTVYKKLIRSFGRGILNSKAEVDRSKLSKIVFSDCASLKKLNNIIHPEVIKLIKNKIKTVPSGLIVLDVPLLIESGLNDLADKLIVVKAPLYKQVKRIQAGKKISRRDILERIKCQIPLREKLRLADFIIDNSATFEKTKKQVMSIWEEMWKN